MAAFVKLWCVAVLVTVAVAQSTEKSHISETLESTTLMSTTESIIAQVPTSVASASSVSQNSDENDSDSSTIELVIPSNGKGMESSASELSEEVVRVRMKKRKTNRKLPFRRKDLMRQRKKRLQSRNAKSTIHDNTKEVSQKDGNITNLPELQTGVEDKHSIPKPKHASNKKKIRRPAIKSNLEKIENKSNKNDAILPETSNPGLQRSLSSRGRKRFTSDEDSDVLPAKIKSSPGGPMPPSSSQSRRKKLQRLRDRLRAKKLKEKLSTVEEVKVIEEPSYTLDLDFQSPKLARKRKRKQKVKKEDEQDIHSDIDANGGKMMFRSRSHLSTPGNAAVSFQQSYSPRNLRSQLQNFQQVHPTPRLTSHEIGSNAIIPVNSYGPPRQTPPVGYGPPRNSRPPPPTPSTNYGSPIPRPPSMFPPNSRPGPTLMPTRPPQMTFMPAPGRGVFGSPPLGTPPPNFARPSLSSMMMSPVQTGSPVHHSDHDHRTNHLRSTAMGVRPLVINSAPPSGNKFSQFHANPSSFSSPQPPFSIHRSPRGPHSSFSSPTAGRPRVPIIRQTVPQNSGFFSSSGPVAITQQVHSFPGLQSPQPISQSQPNFNSGTRKPFNPVRAPPKPSHSSTSINSFNSAFSPGNILPLENQASSFRGSQNTFSGNIDSTFGVKHSNTPSTSTISDNIQNFHTKGNTFRFSEPDVVGPPSFSFEPPPTLSPPKSHLSSVRPSSSPQQIIELFPEAPLPKDHIDFSQHGPNSLPVINTFHRLKLNSLVPPFETIGPNKPFQPKQQPKVEERTPVSNSIIDTSIKTNSQITKFQENAQGAGRPSKPPFGAFRNSLRSTASPQRGSENPIIHSVTTIRSPTAWLSSQKNNQFPVITPSPVSRTTTTLTSSGLLKPSSVTTFRPNNKQHQFTPNHHNTSPVKFRNFRKVAEHKKAQMLDSLRALSTLASKPIPPKRPHHTKAKFRNLIHSSEELADNGILHNTHSNSPSPFPRGQQNRQNVVRFQNTHANSLIPKSKGDTGNINTVRSSNIRNFNTNNTPNPTILLSSPAPSASFFNEKFRKNTLPSEPPSPHLSPSNGQPLLRPHSHIQAIPAIQNLPLEQLNINNFVRNGGNRNNLADDEEIILINTENDSSTSIPPTLLEILDFSRFRGRSFIFMRTNGHEYSVLFPLTAQQENLVNGIAEIQSSGELQGLASEEVNEFIAGNEVNINQETFSSSRGRRRRPFVPSPTNLLQPPLF